MSGKVQGGVPLEVAAASAEELMGGVVPGGTPGHPGPEEANPPELTLVEGGRADPMPRTRLLGRIGLIIVGICLLGPFLLALWSRLWG